MRYTDADTPRAKPPSWVVTFADLMSLLLCFFVLLLSYSEMDAQKFHQLAIAMNASLGQQPRLDQVIPPINSAPPTATSQDKNPEASAEDKASDDVALALGKKLQALTEQTRADGQQLTDVLRDPIARGELEIETQGQQIVVRRREQGSFESGSAALSPGAEQVLREVRRVLVDKPGSILVQGHTDDRPIKTARFRSNWELSAVRAVAVAESLMADGQVSAGRFEVTGLADTRPLVANDSAQARSRNRRVEIVISRDIQAELNPAERRLLQQAPGKLRPARPPTAQPKPLPENIF